MRISSNLLLLFFIFMKQLYNLASLAKEAKRNGITTQEADILLEWGREINPNDTKGLKGRDDRDSVHWKGGSHIHVGGQDHIPVNK